MIDHITFAVRDYEVSKKFYIEVFKAIGVELVMEPMPGAAGFGRNGKPDFWIGAMRPSYWNENHHASTAPIHIAFKARSREEVDAFFAAAIKAGATEHGKPGVREIYHPNYYGAFVIDPDGNNIEAVFHG